MLQSSFFQSSDHLIFFITGTIIYPGQVRVKNRHERISISGYFTAQKNYVKLKLKKMKKLILIFLAAIAFSCGDGSNRSSESESDIQTEDNYSNDALESDTTQMEMDTTSTPGMDGGQGGLDTTSVESNNP